MKKDLKNQKISKEFIKPQKSLFFFLIKNRKCLKEEKKLLKKNPILLVLPFEEISIWPELSSPPYFRIQGGGGTLSVTQEQEQ